MTQHRTFGKMISACMLIISLTLGINSARSQGITTHTFTQVGSATATPNPTTFYIKIGGLMGPAKGYTNKGIECHSFNNAVAVPDRLKEGTYTVQFVDAGGKAFTATTGMSLVVTSKPRDVATGMPSGKRMHKPITITKEIDKASPLMFNIAAADVDEDGMLDVMIAVKKQGNPTPSHGKN